MDANSDTFVVTFPNGEARRGLTRSQVADIRVNNYEGHGTMHVKLQTPVRQGG